MQDVRNERHRYIGGSDIPVIMNISPFKKRFDLLLEKAQIQINEFNGNDYTEYGNLLEPQIRDFINTKFNDPFEEHKMILGDVRCHVDGFNGSSILEIKTTSKIHDDVNDYKQYLVQLLFYMHYYKADKGYLAIYERPNDFHPIFEEKNLTIYEINYNDYTELVEKILNAVDQFRSDLEKVKENPFITEEELQPNELIEISNKLIALENQLASYKKLEKEYEEFKQKLFAAMEKYDIKKWESNNGFKFTKIDKIDDKAENVDEFNLKKFKEENPELYNQYCETKTKIKKGKAGYVKITLPK